jgi:hypothetical protein
MTVDPVGYHSRASVSGVRWGELGLKLSLTDVALRHVRRDQTSQDTDVFNQVRIIPIRSTPIKELANL